MAGPASSGGIPASRVGTVVQRWQAESLLTTASSWADAETYWANRATMARDPWVQDASETVNSTAFYTYQVGVRRAAPFDFNNEFADAVAGSTPAGSEDSNAGRRLYGILVSSNTDAKYKGYGSAQELLLAWAAKLTSAAST